MPDMMQPACPILHDSLPEYSKDLASGASSQGRGIEPHSCRVHTCLNIDAAMLRSGQTNQIYQRKWLRCPTHRVIFAAWFEALASGASPQGRALEPRSCHFFPVHHAGIEACGHKMGEAARKASNSCSSGPVAELNVAMDVTRVRSHTDTVSQL